MTQVALIADPDVPVDELTMAIWADALDKQMKEVATVWGVEYTPVVYYKTAEGLPPTGIRIANVKMNLDAPGALGYHDTALGIVYSRELFQDLETTPITISHEDAEEAGDPYCNLYKPWDDANEQAFELSDRVEGDDYIIQGAVGNETRDVRVSNWLLPSAFDPAGKYPFDKMGKLQTWNGMTDGGYVILRSKATGETTDVFAQHRARPRLYAPNPKAHAAIVARLARPESRLRRRLEALSPARDARIMSMFGHTAPVNESMIAAVGRVTSSLRLQLEELERVSKVLKLAAG